MAAYKVHDPDCHVRRDRPHRVVALVEELVERGAVDRGWLVHQINPDRGRKVGDCQGEQADVVGVGGSAFGRADELLDLRLGEVCEDKVGAPGTRLVPRQLTSTARPSAGA